MRMRGRKFAIVVIITENHFQRRFELRRGLPQLLVTVPLHITIYFVGFGRNSAGFQNLIVKYGVPEGTAGNVREGVCSDTVSTTNRNSNKIATSRGGPPTVQILP